MPVEAPTNTTSPLVPPRRPSSARVTIRSIDHATSNPEGGLGAELGGGRGTTIPEAGTSNHLSPDPRLSPILARSPLVQPQSPQPEFAELLTPARLRRKRRHLPTVLPSSVAGPSRLGWQTEEGDVYRGAVNDPTVPASRLDKAPTLEDDAVTFSSGSSSTWSLGSIVSDLERARGRTVAAIERFGERIGVRRGSDSTQSVASSRLDHVHEIRAAGGMAGRRRVSMSRRLTRTLTRRSSVSTMTDAAPRREYIPRKREFTLLLPESEGGGDRMVATPSLPVVLDRIKGLRLRSGMITDEPPMTPVDHSGHGHGRPRRPKGPSRRQTSFVPPPVPTRIPSQSRIQTLRMSIATTPYTAPPSPALLGGVTTPGGTTNPLFALSPVSPTGTGTAKPKSVSDLLHLTSPASAPDLTRLKSFPSLPFPGEAHRRSNGAWWLDVACPTWEDLRDIGELLALHPLTLEDVLQQDPREKLDMFEKLGYYFVVIRALDETYFKYTPGTGSVTSIGKASPSTGASPAVNGQSEGASKQGSPSSLGGAANAIGEDGSDHQDEKKKEGRRRGWGMGRAVGKLASRQGEKVEIVEDNPGREGLEGVGVGAVNVYLAVFADGVISFHYDDISKHTTRVRDRILSLAGSTEHTSDWVAHGLIDSIVDAFFPLIRYVDGEVDDIDSLTIDPSVDPRAPQLAKKPAPTPVGGSPLSLQSITPHTAGMAGMESGDVEMSDMSEKSNSPPTFSNRDQEKSIGIPSPSTISPPDPTTTQKTRFKQKIKRHLPAHRLAFSVHWPKHLILSLLYLRLFFLPISAAVRHKYRAPEPIFDRMTMLHRITDLRRLVSGLTRLLGMKHQVVGRMRKRAEEGGSAVVVYMGDVEDHILLLQTSLLHYEYILAHCQPAYLSQLSVSFHITRGRIATNILALSTVAISVLPMQFSLGLFGMNTHIPHDGTVDHVDIDGNPAGFNWFAGLAVWIFLVACTMMQVIRYWRWGARQKFAKRRGKELPTWWEGYWGWK